MIVFRIILLMSLSGLACSEKLSLRTGADSEPPTADSDQTSVDAPGSTGDPDFVYSETGEPFPTAVKLTASERLPRAGLVANDVQCALCHVSVLGDVISTSSVGQPKANSDATIFGRWLGAGNLPVSGGLDSVTIDFQDGRFPNYKGTELPIDQNADGKADFPAIDFQTLEPRMLGSMSATEPAYAGQVATNVAKVHNGNLVLKGSAASPITIDGNILIKGDLVIFGQYKGQGSIYVTGHIYIPRDLRATKSIFPYPLSREAAVAEAQKKASDRSYDGLALAAGEGIFIGDLEYRAGQTTKAPTQSIYFTDSVDWHTSSDNYYTRLGVRRVYDWFPGGRQGVALADPPPANACDLGVGKEPAQPGYESLYSCAFNCATEAMDAIGSFDLVDAILYAKQGVFGLARKSNFSVRGGIITTSLHLVAGSQTCGVVTNPVNNRPSNRAFIEYDWRLLTGDSELLLEISPFFPEERPATLPN